MNIQVIASEYAQVIRDEYDLNSVYIGDAIREVVDGCEEVNYTRNAKQLVDGLSGDELCDAEDMVEECFGHAYLSFCKHITMLAYFALVAAMEQEMSDEMEAQA